jgi:hypothetical protein
MKSRYLNLALVGLALIATSLAPAARADEWDKKTIIKIDAPVQIQNTVLDPGQHVLKLLNSDSQRNIVLVFNADETKLETTVLANFASRLEPADGTRFTFYETHAGSPEVLHTWFYPGDTIGLEFPAPKL